VPRKEERSHIDASVTDIDPYAKLASRILKQAVLEAISGDFLAAKWLKGDLAKSCADLLGLDREKIKSKAHQLLGNPEGEILIKVGGFIEINQEVLDCIYSILEKIPDSERMNWYLMLFNQKNTENTIIDVIDIKTKKTIRIE